MKLLLLVLSSLSLIALGAGEFKAPNGILSQGSVKIGATGTPAVSAALDVSSTTKGFAQPRMLTAQRDAIASSVPGLSVFNNSTAFPNFFDGLGWREVVSATGTQTITNKTAAVGSNHITGTVGKLAQFNSGTGDLEASSAASSDVVTQAVPSAQRFTATGSQTGWLFTISTSSTLAVSDTYTNNGNTYTVLGALSAQSGDVLYMSGTGATSGGTLTRSSGSGTTPITFTSKVALATYTTSTSPRTPLYLEVFMLGGGGGGSGSGTSGYGAGGNGTASYFGANILKSGGGVGGSVGTPGTGGSCTVSSGTAIGFFDGGPGHAGGENITVSATQLQGGAGAASCEGGAGGGGYGTTDGTAAAANTGAGGGGAGSHVTAADFAGSGGAASCCIRRVLISSPAATYPYVIGVKGGAGTAGTNGHAGGAGADGVLAVTEHYQ